MKEDFLHYVWKFQKFPYKDLVTTQGETLQVINVGFYNQHDGPDFKEAQLMVGPLKWIGSVEVHLRSSDWYRHNHQLDQNYDTVVLHVVWEDDVEVCRRDGSILPTLVLKHLVAKDLLLYYHETFLKAPTFIPCESQLLHFPQPLLQLWKERLYVARLEEKSERIQELLKIYKNDWEAVLFCLLARNFGLNINGASFFAMANSIPFKVIRKLQHDKKALEALLLGQAGLLSAQMSSTYGASLWKEFQYIKHKFSLSSPAISMQFMRLRPHNFPTIRLAQLASLYASAQQLFAKIFDGKTLNTQWMTRVGVSSYWQTHYTFEKSSHKRDKKIASSFVDLLKINTLIPLAFCYQKAKGNDPTTVIFDLMQAIKPEKNTVVDGFQALGINANNALDTQSFLQLKKEYCQLKKCLLCNVGVYLLNHPNTNYGKEF